MTATDLIKALDAIKAERRDGNSVDDADVWFNCGVDAAEAAVRILLEGPSIR
ncbi:hypothetical protein ABZ128_09525 [Streptomyces sp. NPDC006326]|uniref:hypothetical protein n=1 Tax=Streptomyces sp. NPDC006326 TaxID=3156752 RepID=UPI0033A3ECC1